MPRETALIHGYSAIWKNMGKRFNIPTKTTTVALNHQQTNANEK